MKHSKLLFAVAAACLIGPASAGSCIGNWPGTQRDAVDRNRQMAGNLLHLAGSAAVVGGVAWATNDLTKAILAGVAVGAAREVYKATQPGMRCEWSAMAFDAAGIALGAYTANRWVIRPTFDGGVAVSYNITFNVF